MSVASSPSSGTSGINYHNIAHWDGHGWHTLGAGTNAAVNAIAFSGSKVIVGGDFTSTGGVPANAIAAWTGSTWQALGGGMSNPTGAGKVVAIAVDSATGNVYAGGSFVKPGAAREWGRDVERDHVVSAGHRTVVERGRRVCLGDALLGLDALRRGQSHPGRTPEG
jgi:hypothetical protein